MEETKKLNDKKEDERLNSGTTIQCFKVTIQIKMVKKILLHLVKVLEKI